jgi:hypothetical protein
MTKKRLTLAIALGVISTLWVMQPVQAQPPDELGKKIAALYLETMKNVVALMKDRPAPAVLQPKLTQLKEDTVQKMVEFGRKREALDQAGKQKVDAIIENSVKTLPPELFQAFSQANAHYFKMDQNLSKLIMAFHLIPQYAIFEVLKKHAPQEAERLGIK